MRRVLVGIVIAVCLPSPGWARAKAPRHPTSPPAAAAASEPPSPRLDCRSQYRRALAAQKLAIMEGDPDSALEAALRAQDAFQSCVPFAPPREVENEWTV